MVCKSKGTLTSHPTPSSTEPQHVLQVQVNVNIPPHPTPSSTEQTHVLQQDMHRSTTIRGSNTHITSHPADRFNAGTSWKKHFRIVTLLDLSPSSKIHRKGLFDGCLFLREYLIAKFIKSALERFDLFKEHRKAKILALWISFALSLAGKQESF